MWSGALRVMCLFGGELLGIGALLSLLFPVTSENRRGSGLCTDTAGEWTCVAKSTWISFPFSQRTVPW